MRLYNERNHSDNSTPSISTEVFAKYLLNEIDICLIQSDGIESPEIPLPVCISFAYGRDDELNQINKSIPDGITIKYEKQNSKSNRLVFKAFIEPDYAAIRFNTILYSEEFASRLINNRNEEIKTMLKAISGYSMFDIGEYGLLVAEDESDRYALTFSSLNLKPLDSITQIYTLSRVLADTLNQTDESHVFSIDAHSYYDCNYTHPYNVTQRIRIGITKSSRPISRPQNNLSEW